MKPPLRVLIVDDHEVFVTSLARTLADEPDLDIVAAVTTMSEASTVAAGGVEVVLTDFRLADGDGVQLTRALVAAHPGIAVVMLTASHDEAVLAAAVDAGCSGFVTKSEPLVNVLAAVRATAAGESVITPALLARLLPRLSTARRGRNPDLTPREREVLVLVVQGMTNSQIAEALVLSHDTVRNHVSSILAKLGVHSKLQAAAAATQRGIVSVPLP